jgi:hypothetical protein
MLRSAIVSLLAVLFLVILVAHVSSDPPIPGKARSEKSKLKYKLQTSSKPDPLPLRRGAAAYLDTVLLVDVDFDDPMGGPDTEGWTSFDFTEQADTFFHVSDFSGVMTGPPLAGSQSLWCGTEDLTGTCNSLYPGYGSRWIQLFESVAFPVTGNVPVEFMAHYDSEAGYDFTRLDYLSKTDNWQTLAELSGLGDTLVSETIPADSLDGSVRLRFRFTSDHVWDDEDGIYDTNGAVIIDNITVSDDGGIVDYQDFESESDGDLGTADGDWQSSVGPPFGDYAGLFDGTTVLQEDPVVTNTTYLWGFFNGSTETYACGGHPEQASVPLFRGDVYPAAFHDKIFNQIQSPFFDFDTTASGDYAPGFTHSLLIEFDVYEELPLAGGLYYQVYYRFQMEDCISPWYHTPLLQSGNSKTWQRWTDTYAVPNGATGAQVAVNVEDVPYLFPYDPPTCRSHSPLIDNIQVKRLSTPIFVVTNTNSSGTGSMRQAILDANANPDSNLIRFDIPGPGPHSILPYTQITSIMQPVTIDGFTQPGASPNTNPMNQPCNGVIKIELDGTESDGFSGLRITGDHVTIRGLAINRFEDYGILIDNADSCVIEGNFIGTDVTGTIDLGNTLGGIRANLDAGLQVTIGGTSEAARNVISGNGNHGVHLNKGTNHRVYGNFIGVDATGTTDLGNSKNGVWLQGTTNPQIGNGTLSHRNILSGNNFNGVEISGTEYNTGIDNYIRGNYIGTGITGSEAIGNEYNGIEIDGDSDDIVYIGSSSGEAGEQNLIAFNSGAGVRIHGHGDKEFQVYANSIHSNSSLGIDLLTGAFSSPPAPGIGSVTSTGNTVTLAGSLEANPSRPYQIRFYANTICDPSGSGEGEEYLAVIEGTSDGTGYMSFDTTLSLSVPGGKLITATAHENEFFQNKCSAFSECVENINTEPGTNVVVQPVNEETGETPVTMTFDEITSSGATTLSAGDCDPPPAESFTIDTTTCYDISTTAGYTGSIEVCFEYDEGNLPGDESLVRLAHYVDPDWVNITTNLDTEANVVCGEVSSLSPFIIGIGSVTGIQDPPPVIPSEFALHPNVPNPFNPTTEIRFDVPAGGARLTLAVYDVSGRLVKTLVSGYQNEGRKQVTWNGRNQQDQQVSTGVYFYRLTAADFRQTRKMVLIK